MDQELIYLYHLGSQIAYEMLLKQYKHIIEKYFAARYRGSHEILQEDYVQIALIAFNKMLDHYRFDMKTKVSTYFSYAIKDAMYSAIRYVRLQKHIPYDKLVSLSEIMQGHALKETVDVYSPDVQLRVQEKLNYYHQLVEQNSSAFEKKVFDYLMAGYRFDEIASLLDVDVKKVYNAKYRIQKKLEKSKSV